MSSKVDTDEQLRAWADAFVTEYGQWFCIHDKKWWWRHEYKGSWDTTGARERALGRVSESVTQLDMGKYAWAWERNKQEFALRRVLERIVPRITVDRIPGPDAGIAPEVLERLLLLEQQNR